MDKRLQTDHHQPEATGHDRSQHANAPRGPGSSRRGPAETREEHGRRDKPGGDGDVDAGANNAHENGYDQRDGGCLDEHRAFAKQHAEVVERDVVSLHEMVRQHVGIDLRDPVHNDGDNHRYRNPNDRPAFSRGRHHRSSDDQSVDAGRDCML